MILFFEKSSLIWAILLFFIYLLIKFVVKIDCQCQTLKKYLFTHILENTKINSKSLKYKNIIDEMELNFQKVFQ